MTGRWRPPFRRPVRPLTAPTAAHGAFAPQPLGLAGLGLSLGVRPASARPALRTPSQISGTSTPPIPEGPEDGGAPQAPAASAVAAAAAGSGCGIPAHLNFPGRIRSFTIQRDSTGSQSLAERVVEQQGMLLGVGGAGMSRVGSAMRLQDAEDAQSTVRHSPAHVSVVHAKGGRITRATPFFTFFALPYMWVGIRVPDPPYSAFCCLLLYIFITVPRPLGLHHPADRPPLLGRGRGAFHRPARRRVHRPRGLARQGIPLRPRRCRRQRPLPLPRPRAAAPSVRPVRDAAALVLLLPVPARAAGPDLPRPHAPDHVA